MTFRSDYDWQLKFLTPIRCLVGPLLLEPAPFEIDAKEATDMLVLRARDMRIGCRVRRAGYAERYPWDFTIRAKRDNGARTELGKIVEGWGDWLFYGHAAHDDLPTISRWFLIDLSAFRAHLIRSRHKVRPEMRSNGDGTHFVSFDVRKFPSHPSILVSSSEVVPAVRGAAA